MESFYNNILLSNLIKIRWIAIIGQLATILLVFFFLKINIPINACLCIVSISSIINIYSYLTNKKNDYLILRLPAIFGYGVKNGLLYKVIKNNYTLGISDSVNSETSNPRK